MYTPQNNLLYHEAEKRFGSYAEQNNAYGFVSINRYIEIDYYDIFGDEHSEIYYVDPITGCSEFRSGIRRPAALQAIKLHKESVSNGLSVEIANAEPETIMKKFTDFQAIKKENYPILHFLW